MCRSAGAPDRTVELPEWAYENALLVVGDVRAKGVGCLPTWAQDALHPDVREGRRPFAVSDALELAALALRRAAKECS